MIPIIFLKNNQLFLMKMTEMLDLIGVMFKKKLKKLINILKIILNI